MARILLVEDDVDVRELFEGVLLDSGYEVDTAEGVTDGLGLLQAAVYDLVLTDGRLRDGTGIALADQATIQDIPALIITGYALMFREAMDNPAHYRILLKPIRPAELLHAVAEILAERRSSREGRHR
jgi:two-component system response regulator PilR (NtrC family)